MKKKEELKAVREMDKDQAKEELAKTEREMLNLQFRKASSGIPKSSELRRLRTKIARIETVLKEKTLSA